MPAEHRCFYKPAPGQNKMIDQLLLMWGVNSVCHAMPWHQGQILYPTVSLSPALLGTERRNIDRETQRRSKKTKVWHFYLWYKRCSVAFDIKIILMSFLIIRVCSTSVYQQFFNKIHERYLLFYNLILTERKGYQFITKSLIWKKDEPPSLKRNDKSSADNKIASEKARGTNLPRVVISIHSCWRVIMSIYY